MKTAVSIPDEVYHAADRLARRSRKSRSQVYADALREFLQRHEADPVTQALDDLCAEVDSTLPPDLARAGRRVLEGTEW
ncbi:MAG: ribbon-helix-helix protein, CopG family [Deltaproteobacteria bacterium]|nr:ribbon-helix-helix protein, CopG family [Deltaproteobacteria bacterium]